MKNKNKNFWKNLWNSIKGNAASIAENTAEDINEIVIKPALADLATDLKAQFGDDTLLTEIVDNALKKASKKIDAAIDEIYKGDNV